MSGYKACDIIRNTEKCSVCLSDPAMAWETNFFNSLWEENQRICDYIARRMKKRGGF